MVTLDLWLPPSYVLDSWDVLDSGQLGPATRSTSRAITKHLSNLAKCHLPAAY